MKELLRIKNINFSMMIIFYFLIELRNIFIIFNSKFIFKILILIYLIFLMFSNFSEIGLITLISKNFLIISCI